MHEDSFRPGDRVHIVDQPAQAAAYGTDGIVVGATARQRDTDEAQIIVTVDNALSTNAMIPAQSLELQTHSEQ